MSVREETTRSHTQRDGDTLRGELVTPSRTRRMWRRGSGVRIPVKVGRKPQSEVPPAEMYTVKRDPE